MDLLRKITITIMIAIFYIKMVLVKCFDYQGMELLLIGFVSYLFCIFTIDFHKMQKSILLVVFFGIITLISPSALNFAILILILYVLKDCDIRYVAKLNVVFSLLVFAFLAFAIAAGIIVDEPMTAADGHSLRYAFGLGNPHSLAITIFGMLCNIYFLMAKDYKWLTVLILTVVTFLVAEHSGSRTFAAVMIFIIVYTIFQRRASVKPSTHKLIRMLPLILAGMTLGGAFAVRLMPIIDVFFSFRLSLYNQLISQSSLFEYLVGNPMIDVITIDSSYLEFIFSGGIGGGVLFYYLFNNTIKNLSDEYRYLLPMIAGIMLYATTESFLIAFTTFSNMILWIFIFQNGFSKRKIETQE